ncbi:uncharacterized protein LOC110603379 isoform X4 [Manihot esculenta]|uniref:uncharacterized protein LOC110603379 isoform X4 n=1 Tax=Manihot esculenta TaxID=3983 RepID=UPI001CC4C8E6|nr:uncharacterized protein LOC110603379 isoform X4 [Manihot esculenta]
MMWASVRRKVLSGSSTTYLVLEQSLPGTCFMAPLSRSYSNPLKVEENMRLRTELQKKIQELEKYVLNLENMDKTRHWKIVGCSAYTGEGLLEGFDWLVQDMMIP